MHIFLPLMMFPRLSNGRDYLRKENFEKRGQDSALRIEISTTVGKKLMKETEKVWSEQVRGKWQGTKWKVFHEEAGNKYF